MARDRRLTRRDLLQRAGWAAAAAASPARPACAAWQRGAAVASGQTAADFPTSDVMTRLSTYMSEARDRALPDEVLEQAKWHVLDTIAAMVSGSELAPGRAAIAFARAYGGKEVATVVGDTILCGPIEAALANGMMAHADETDDTLARAGGIRAATSCPRRWRSASSSAIERRALPARRRARLRHRHARAGHDRPGLANSHKLTHGIGGIFGAAAAAGCAAEPRRAEDALGARVHGAAELRHRVVPARPRPHREGLHLRRHARAQRRHVGPAGPRRLERRDDIMAGPDNFLLANAPTGKAELLIDKLGERYELTRTNIKSWTVGRRSTRRSTRWRRC